ncbi:glycosyltransferase involved in cell wall biosynthesis [Pullulanibacillus pueri]|uniref:Glycosyl transferase family 2 n=1 Tax=Pullulanibacillus pueri TaxID=1437324 RepID=A0A8J3EMQ7_9BACL|nr:glycosyltransferase [Pullulanibacillus pueri]MBM7682436.1 glycosyltransferase involved in cell wall biosynthesis [Pullulanibacillus pueri]GGH81647.1 glycosyl transferase family 2 [Pullulanibacillus pueri]
MKPAISIIVPVYNDGPYLRDCIDSILYQEFKNYEVILVNDGSTDDSKKICDTYAQLDPRIRVIHQEYAGVSSARNRGINIAKGEYIGFVDGDDRIDKSMYEILYNLAMTTKSDVSICQLGREINGKLINEEEKRYELELSNLEAMQELFKGNLYRYSLCNKLFHKKCFSKIKFPVGRIHEDLSTIYILLSRANKVVFTNYIGYIYVKRQNSILTTKYNNNRLDAFLGWEEILSFMRGSYPSIYNEVTSGFAYWIVDDVYYILNQVDEKGERNYLLNEIRRYLRNHFKEIKENDLLSLKYKSIITLLNMNYKVLLIINRIKALTKNSKSKNLKNPL